jgi:tetratricopeptide (TPR) repeat protein
MAGAVRRLLAGYQHLLVGRLSAIFTAPLGRSLMRALGVQDGVASHYFAEAHAFANTGQYEKSIKACEASIAVRPDFMPAYETLIQVLTHTERYRPALDACVRALQASPDSEAIAASLRQILPRVRATEHPDQVIASLDKCLAANPARVEVFTLLVDMLSQLHRYRQIVEACQRVLDVDPEFFPAAEMILNVLKDPNAQQEVAELRVATPPQASDEYEWLVASNVTDSLVEIMSRFYREVGTDPHHAPLLQGLDRFQRKLSASKPGAAQSQLRSTLVLFETAWKQYRSGQIKKALRAFQTIFNDTTARQRAAHNPYLKEAVVRSGEILGRHHDKLGDVETAIGIYRDIMSIDQDGLVARRLTLLLSRRGRLREAADHAEAAIISRPNLFGQLRPNRYLASLKADISLKSTDG